MTQPVLIIEDDPLNLKLAKMVLELQGFDVRVAMNAQEGLQVLAEFEPQLILLDIKLPDMDGLLLVRKLKADQRYQHIKIIAITAYAMKGDREKILEAGCDNYLSKPVEPGFLVECIRYCLDSEAAITKSDSVESG